MSESNVQPKTWLIAIAGVLVLLCLCALGTILAGRSLFGPGRILLPDGGPEEPARDLSNATLIVAVSPEMDPALEGLVASFNAQGRTTPDGTAMQVQTVKMVPEKMVNESLETPTFQAIAPDSSLWLGQLDRRWADLQAAALEEGVVPIGNRRFSDPVRYAVSPIVLVAWESVARELGWPDQPVGWGDIQRRATADPNFKWNHPSTAHASGMLATLAEFYAGAGLTRGLTPELATSEATLAYVRAVEATVRFYGEGGDVIVRRLDEEGRDFLDAFVAQEQVVIAWNQIHAEQERLVALYPAEGTLWADHPLALLELGTRAGEAPVTDNQRRTYRAFVEHITGPEAQRQLLAQGYRPADLNVPLDGADSPFVDTIAVDWREPQTTLQVPSEEVVEVVQNVWWYTKRPTNVYLVVDTSGSMEGSKMAHTKIALQAFVDQIRGDRDQVGLIAFASDVEAVRSLRHLDESGRADVSQAIEQLRAQGNTALIDGVWEAYTHLLTEDDPEAINAIVVMTDGQENDSRHTLSDLRRRFQSEQGPSVVLFTIAFGDDADEALLRSMAELGGGQFRRADETEIEELYKIISTYF
jgi:Ca-activated chloride channel family protein